jgi:hypothetical protein
MYPSVYFILLLVTLLAQAPPPIENKYPKGLPATLAGFEDEAKFIVIVGDGRPGTMTSSWRMDGSYTATTEVTVAGQKVTRSTAITPDADGRWKEIRRTPYKKDLMELEGRFWARRGYVYAVQDCRGRFGSQGERGSPSSTKPGTATTPWSGWRCSRGRPARWE